MLDATGQRPGDPWLAVWAAEILRVLGGLTSVLQGGRLTEPVVHKSRRELKRLRSLLRLAPAALADLADDTREVTGELRRRLGHSRDATVMLKTLQSLSGELGEAASRINPVLSAHHRAASASLDRRSRRRDRDRMARFGAIWRALPIKGEGRDLHKGAVKTYRRARRHARALEKGKEAASHVLETAAADISFERGNFTIVGTDRSISIMELAHKLRNGGNLPPDAPQSLDVDHISDGPSASTYPNGCHIAEVEVDPETGAVEVASYACVNDFGVVVNPMIVAGQLHGGVVQGIGQALMEKTVYDGEGQLLTGSFMDYAMPRAVDVPSFVLEDHPAPAKTNPLGVKGCGEAGCAGALTSIMNAVIDALAERGIRHIDMPLTPASIWQALRDAEAKSGVASKQ